MYEKRKDEDDLDIRCIICDSPGLLEGMKHSDQS
jgi:hypothetical protein